jgi:hypothetical protein
MKKFVLGDYVCVGNKRGFLVRIGYHAEKTRLFISAWIAEVSSAGKLEETCKVVRLSEVSTSVAHPPFQLTDKQLTDIQESIVTESEEKMDEENEEIQEEVKEEKVEAATSTGPATNTRSKNPMKGAKPAKPQELKSTTTTKSTTTKRGSGSKKNNVTSSTNNNNSQLPPQQSFQFILPPVPFYPQPPSFTIQPTQFDPQYEGQSKKKKSRKTGPSDQQQSQFLPVSTYPQPHPAINNSNNALPPPIYFTSPSNSTQGPNYVYQPPLFQQQPAYQQQPTYQQQQHSVYQQQPGMYQHQPILYPQQQYPQYFSEKFCPECGHSEFNCKFCSECGHKRC